MPYLDKSTKARLRPLLDAISLDSPGELCYAVSVLMMNQSAKTQPVSFTSLIQTIKAVEKAAEEFDRRILSPYESQKARENGDIYKDFIREVGINTLFG